jgi:DNA polymerase III subunit delta'
MIGHDLPERALLDGWASGRLHHAWLLAGPQGLGKAHFAQRVATFLLTRPDASAGSAPDGLDTEGDGVAARLIAAGNHPELIRLERIAKEAGKEVARNISVDQVRGLIGRMQMTIALGHWRVAIIDAIDDLEPGAANALLKTLEEPPAKTLFLLVSHSPGRLLPTIRSRCRLLRFQSIDDAALADWLRAQRPLAEHRQLLAAVTASGGIPGRALELVDGDTAAMEARLLAIASSGDSGNKLREALARDVGGAAGKARFRLLLDLAPRMLLRLAREAGIERTPAFVASWDQVQAISRTAISGSYDAAMIGFEIGNCFAALADEGASPVAA